METEMRKGTIERSRRERVSRAGTRNPFAICRAIAVGVAVSLALVVLFASCAHRAAKAGSVDSNGGVISADSESKTGGASKAGGKGSASGKDSGSGGTASPSVARKASLAGKFSILSGALAWSRKDWAAATAFFLDAERAAAEKGNEAVRQYAVYGLASTYLAEDEYDSALARLSALDARLSSEIGSGIWYQAGIVAFREGEYAKAASMFRKSLECDPSRADAKINLELSARCLSESDANRDAADSSFSGDASPDGASDAIFNLVRKKERDRWKNQEEQSARADVADY